ncbi:low CO2-induced aldose reductase isoform B [Micractinium conductrix]|uniref:Low CO2-induced aldose reductase isoform B n=1 Tax=Micractinium conductrix TaxID=554055 RepID=A0A2P6V823_9CHLO|nr:low CO2-induced aldose reductase isoform B [Micractinium conductrix]|eukprot:PSC70237.1 low CO2-induced aldose reductase isoform B [Micractinium conductrix]
MASQPHAAHHHPRKRLRVLALHSFRTSGAIFAEQQRRAGLDAALADLIDVTYIDAPNAASGPIPDDVAPHFEGPYYEWWNASRDGEGRWSYEGWRRAVAHMEDTLALHGPFDGLMGFSQGGAMASLAIGMQRCGFAFKGLPLLRFVVAFAGIRVRDPQLERFYAPLRSCPSLHVLGDRDPVKRLTNLLIECFEHPVVVTHPRGHVIPQLPPPDLERHKAGEMKEVVEAAVRMGYRHIDCAAEYENEGEVGETLAAVLADGTVRREELWVTSKLRNEDHDPNRVGAACKESLSRLGLDHLDLYLMHWPVTGRPGPAVDPPLSDTWRAMEGLVRSGLARSIGVSNFSVKKLEGVLAGAQIPPAVNQVEAHPYFRNDQLLEWCKARGIHITAYSPLGSPHTAPFFKRRDDLPELLQDATLRGIADKHGRAPAEVLVSWAVQRGTSCLPKSTKPDHLRANLAAASWRLPEEDFQALSTLRTQCRMLDGAWCVSPDGPYRSLEELWDTPHEERTSGVRRCAEMNKSWQRWKDDPFRRSMSEHHTGIDVIGARGAAALMLTHSICFIWLKEGRPAGMLACVPYVLMCLALASLAQRRRRFYTAHRELLVTLLHLAQTLTNYHTILHAGEDVYRMHNGKPLRLALQQLAGGPIFITICALHLRLPLAWSLAALPAMTLAPLAYLPGLCRRLMATPGAEDAVVGLFRIMDTFQQCCMLYSTWSVVLCSAVIPLAVTYVLERRARWRYHAREAARGTGSAPDEAAPLLPATGAWLADAYLASCLVWAVAEVIHA